MTRNTRAVVLRALQQYRGDDLERAEAAFRHYTAQQLASEYGQSGRTCQQILDEYRDHVARVEAAVNEVQGL